MKYSIILVFGAQCLTGTVWAEQANSLHNPASGMAPASPTQITISPDEWQKLRAARSAAFQANPSLLTDNKKLVERMRALEDKVDAAMVKANPNIAPLLAKFEAGRQHTGVPANSPSSAK